MTKIRDQWQLVHGNWLKEISNCIKLHCYSQSCHYEISSNSGILFTVLIETEWPKYVAITYVSVFIHVSKP